MVIIMPRLVLVDKEIDCRGIGFKFKLNLQGYETRKWFYVLLLATYD